MDNLKWIFFDLGWTLFDETPSHHARLRKLSRTLREFGHHVRVDDMVHRCEQAATEFEPSPFFGMLRSLNLSKDQHERIRSDLRYDHSHEVFYPGVPALLTELSERFRLGVIANQSKGTEQRLKSRGIWRDFSTILASAELGLSKPDPRIFHAALSESKCRPEEALMVGDRVDNDIAPAKAQGWHTIRVLQGFSRFQRPRNPSEEANLTISKIGELKRVL